MIRVSSTLFALLFFLMAFSGVAQARSLPPRITTSKQLVNAQTQFALHLYKQLANKKGNLLFSPYSVSTALTMTFAGARRATAREMAKVLRLTGNPSLLTLAGRDMRELMKRAKQSGFQLSIANRLWGQKKYPFNNSFLNLLNTHYDAGLELLDFKADPAAARKVINAWVEKQTQKKIKDLIPRKVLKRDTRLVLTNAVYFKAKWASQFKKRNTHSADFWLTKSKRKKVKMMHQIRNFQYKAVKGLRILKVPYKGHQTSMVILLPKKKEGWQEVQKRLNATTWKQWTTGMKWKRVALGLPRFRFTAKARLKKALQKMGMKQAFTNFADFSGMVKEKRRNTHRLKIDKVLHKAFIHVREGGTEAAAATAVIMIRATSAGIFRKPVRFVADRPFLFAIQDNKTGSLLFLGRVMKP